MILNLKSEKEMYIYESLLFDWHTSVTLSDKYIAQFGDDERYRRYKTLPIVSNLYKKLKENNYLDSIDNFSEVVKRKKKGDYIKPIKKYRANIKAYLEYYKWTPLPQTRLFLTSLLSLYQVKDIELPFGKIKHGDKCKFEEIYKKERVQNSNMNVFEILSNKILKILIDSDVKYHLLNEPKQIRWSNYLKKYNYDFKKLKDNVNNLDENSDLWQFLFSVLNGSPEDIFITNPEILVDLINNPLKSHKLLFEKTYYLMLTIDARALYYKMCGGKRSGRKQETRLEKEFFTESAGLLKVYEGISNEKIDSIWTLIIQV